MSSLSEKLGVLSICIDYRNLTSASQHVGLSQPQLSRIIRQIEDELAVVLLDRSSPRHSTWTPEARGIAEIYLKSEKSLSSELGAYIDGAVQRDIKIGCLEGLSGLGVDLAAKLLEGEHIQTVTLNLYDLNQLEAKFLSLDLDLAFTSRSPGNKKLTYEKDCGVQVLKKVQDKSSDYQVLSSFEGLRAKPARSGKTKRKLISNSLAVRKIFQEKYGGSILLPSEVQTVKRNSKDEVPVLLIGQDYLPQSIWGQV